MNSFDKKEVKNKKKIRLHYFRTENLGDSLNAVMIRELFGINIVWAPFSKAEMISIGSLLDRLIRGSFADSRDILQKQKEADAEVPIHVWGTGLMYQYGDTAHLAFVRPVEIHAVRGELTRKTVEKITGRHIACALGDPAMLAPYMLDDIPEKTCEFGIIPHVAEYGMREYEEIHRSVEGSVVIDMTGDPKEVMAQIASCKSVISTSLHGLILADAFGVPSKWCRLTDRILGNGFKYRDYYSGFGLEEEAYDLSDGSFPTPEEVQSGYRIRPDAVRKMQIELLKSFPYQNQSVRKRIEEIKHS